MEVTTLRHDHQKLLHDVLDFYVGDDNFDLESVQELFLSTTRLLMVYQGEKAENVSQKIVDFVRYRRVIAEILIEAGLQEFLYDFPDVAKTEPSYLGSSIQDENAVRVQFKQLTKSYPKSHARLYKQTILRHLTYATFLRQYSTDAGLRRNDVSWLEHSIKVWEAISIELVGIDLTTAAIDQANSIFESPEALLLLSDDNTSRT